MSRVIRPLLAAFAVLVVLALGIYLGGHPSGLPTAVSDHLVDKQTRIFSEALDCARAVPVRPTAATLIANIN